MAVAKDAKIAVLGIAERGGRVHLQRISNAKAETLKPILKEKISPETKEIVTDGHPTYLHVVPSIVRVKHKVAATTPNWIPFGELSAKTIEGAFSLFKRGVIGSYHHLSQDHLDSYLQEFCWRFNRRGIQPCMFGALLREPVTKKPMTYRHLTREVF